MWNGICEHAALLFGRGTKRTVEQSRWECWLALLTLWGNDNSSYLRSAHQRNVKNVVQLIGIFSIHGWWLGTDKENNNRVLDWKPDGLSKFIHLKRQHAYISWSRCCVECGSSTKLPFPAASSRVDDWGPNSDKCNHQTAQIFFSVIFFTARNFSQS